MKHKEMILVKDIPGGPQSGDKVSVTFDQKGNPAIWHYTGVYTVSKNCLKEENPHDRQK